LTGERCPLSTDERLPALAKAVTACRVRARVRVGVRVRGRVRGRVMVMVMVLVPNA